MKLEREKRDEKQEDKDPTKWSRRALIGGGLATLAAGTVLKRLTDDSQLAPGPEEIAPRPKEGSEITSLADREFLNTEPMVLKYDMGSFAGRPVQGMLSSMTGIKGRMPKIAHIDYRRQLCHLWDKKLDLLQNPLTSSYVEGSLHTAKIMVESYDPKNADRMTFTNYAIKAKKAMEPAMAAFSVDKILSCYPFVGLHFKPEEASIIGEVVRKFKPEYFVSIAMTEVIPSSVADSIFGIRMFDMLLQTAGRKFMNLYPALADSLVSYGDYQHTREAIFGAGDPDTRGAAAVINEALGGTLIPRRLEEFSADDHHRAAYLMGINNVVQLVNDLRPKKGEQDHHRCLFLSKNLSILTPDFVASYTAASHHIPALARKAAKKYVDGMAEYIQDPRGKHVPVFAPLPAEVGKARNIPDKQKRKEELQKLRKAHPIEFYVEKARANRVAISRWLSGGVTGI